MHGADWGVSLCGRSIILGNTRHPIGRTPVPEGTWPEKRNHADSVGVVRAGRRAATSVDDFM
eukprot:3809888-Pleurochrysis_carterae.AAC.1